MADTTNYTKYLKYFLFFIIMLLIIIALLWGGWILFANAGLIRERIMAARPRRQPYVPDPDDISGQGIYSG